MKKERTDEIEREIHRMLWAPTQLERTAASHRVGELLAKAMIADLERALDDAGLPVTS